MEGYSEYTVLELFQLLEILERERFPTGNLYKRKNEIMEEAAKQLDVQVKEIGWLMTSKCQREEAVAEDKIWEKTEHAWEEEKRWTILTRELVALGSSVVEMGKNIWRIKEEVDGLGANLEKLKIIKVEKDDRWANEPKQNGEVVKEEFKDVN